MLLIFKKHIPYLKNILLVASLLIIASCATIVSPSGGPKDETPPQLIRSTPEKSSVNFQDKRITLYFNEFINLQNIEQQLIISPPLSTIPDIKTKGKSIVISIKDTLRQNTTYNIYLGDAIADITENNKLTNFNFAFSTGATIDSLSISGSVTDAYTLLPIKQSLVMLYHDFNDSTPIKQLPVYVTRTTETGQFQLNHLASGKYRAIALLDANNDYLYNLPNEQIAFADDSIQTFYHNIKDTTKNTDTNENKNMNPKPINLFMFAEYDSIQRIEKASMNSKNSVQIIFKYPAKEVIIKPLNASKWSCQEWSDDAKIWQAWLIEKPDTLSLEVSAFNMTTDTLNIATQYKTTTKPKSTDLKDFQITNNLVNNILDYNKPIVLHFSNPISHFQNERLKLIRTDKKDTLSPKTIFIDSIHRHLQISLPDLNKCSYHLLIPDSTFHDIYGNSHDSLAINFQTLSSNEYGTLSLIINKQTPSQLIIQLLNEKDVVLDEKIINSSTRIEFGYLNAQKCRLRAIFDTNLNKKWDTGIYLKKQQPEKILIYPKQIEIRSNWDAEEEWEL